MSRPQSAPTDLTAPCGFRRNGASFRRNGQDGHRNRPPASFQARAASHNRTKLSVLGAVSQFHDDPISSGSSKIKICPSGPKTARLTTRKPFTGPGYVGKTPRIGPGDRRYLKVFLETNGFQPYQQVHYLLPRAMASHGRAWLSNNPILVFLRGVQGFSRP